MLIKRSLLACALAASLCGSLQYVHAQASAKISERARQKQQAEQERAELQKKLGDLKEDIQKTEKAHSHAADALAASEAAISNANRSLRELLAEQAQVQSRLAALTKSAEELQATVKKQRMQLEKNLRGQYQSGPNDPIRLILSGDNPNRISRELRYLGYVSQAQSKAIAALEANLAAIETNKAEAEEARSALEEIANEQREQKALLEREKSNRKKLVSQLSNKLGAQRKEAGNLARDEERLAVLLDRLTNLIAQQRKAEEEAAAARKRARLAKERERPADKPGERQADKKSDKPSGKPAGAEQANKDRAKEIAAADDKETDTVVSSGSGTEFAKLRGKLRMPLKGTIVAGFGAKRHEGPSWKGLFIKAAEGSEVRAAAAGEVIFADWMRGFGNLLILDHGGQYMTIYGNNQAVLKRAGERVKAGDVIAAAGNSGGNEHSGLYFEMRHQGRAIDPLVWIDR